MAGPLDMFVPTQNAALESAQRNVAPDLPATFSDAFESAWRNGVEWSGSVAYQLARANALDDYLQTVRQQTGETVDNPYRTSQADPALPVYLPQDMNNRLAELGQRHPGVGPVSDEMLDYMTLKRMQAARDDAAAMARREKTWGGTFGGLSGELSAGVVDPVNIALLPLGGAGELGIAGRALEFGALSGGSQVANEALQGGAREKVQPGYFASGEPGKNVALATGMGTALGGGFGVLERLLGMGAYRPLPTSVRDDINAATSEAQLAATNVLPGAAGEMAHRDAVEAAVGQVARGEAVTAADTIDPALKAAAAGRDAEEALRPITAREIPDVERAPESVPGFDAFHGSPYRFDKFDVGQIGSGQGAQSFGHGLYLAEEREVARDYSKMFPKNYGPERLAQDVSSSIGSKDPAAILAEIEKRKANGLGQTFGQSYADAANALSSVSDVERALKGETLYQVRVNADRNMFLDLDKSLDEQAPAVQEAVKRAMGVDYHGNFDAAKAERLWNQHKGANGLTAVRNGFIAFDDETVAQRLKDAGVPGLQYLDSGSRKAGEGTRNYVVFGADKLNITHRNDVPLSPDVAAAAVRGVDREGLTRLMADPAVDEGVLRDLDRIRVERPDADYHMAVEQPDGTVTIETRKLEDVLRGLDEQDTAAREMAACVTGAEAAA